MSKEKERKERIRKERKNGEITQKAMTFRVDNDLTDWINAQANKGRAINNAIRAAAAEWLRSRNTQEDDTPHERIEDTWG